MNNYRVGTRIRVSAQFKNASNMLADPTTVTVRLDPPAADTHSYVYGVDSEVVKEATGNYHLDFLADAAGDWAYEWQGTGTVETAQDAILTVSASEVS